MNLDDEFDSMRGLRLMAEWEPHGAVLLTWPHSHTDWAYMLDEVQQCYRNIIDALTSYGSKVVLLAPFAEMPELQHPNLTIVDVDTNDTWIRDYGPLSFASLTTGLPAAIGNFGFNGWGLKYAANLDNMVTENMVRRHMIDVEDVVGNKNFILEGGSIETDGSGLLLTTFQCLSAPNRNGLTTKDALEVALKIMLPVTKVIWVEHGNLIGDDTDGHIDTLCRLAPGNTILYTGCHDEDDPQYPDLTAMRFDLESLTNINGEPFNLIELPLPDPVYDPDDGSRLPATYANYLVTDTAVLLPTYGQPMKDKLAEDTLKVVFDNREIIPIDCRALIRQHGSLHCATMQIPLKFLKI